MSDFPVAETTLREKTGRGWDEWLSILDGFDATRLSHTEMAKRLAAEHPEVGGWWVQTIVVGYERARGLRAKHETKAGFTASISKTIAARVERVFQAWSDPRLRKRWLDTDLDITSSNDPNSIRAKFADGTRLVVGFLSKGDAKSQVALQLSKLPGAESVAEVKKQWKVRLDRLSTFVMEEEGG